MVLGGLVPFEKSPVRPSRLGLRQRFFSNPLVRHLPRPAHSEGAVEPIASDKVEVAWISSARACRQHVASLEFSLMYQRQRGRIVPPSHGRHVKPRARPLPRPPGNRETTRQSDLTFAVIWDPEDGALQSFSGASLGKLTTYADDAVLQSQEKELPKPPPPVPVKTDSIMRLASWQTRFDRTRPLVQRGHTALQADRNVSMLFSDSESIISTSETAYSSDTETIHGSPNQDSDRRPMPHQRGVTKRIPSTPNSDLTFAAIWDPQKGFCTIRDGRIVAVSATPPRPETRPSKLLYEDTPLSSAWDMQTIPDEVSSSDEYQPSTPSDSLHGAYNTLRVRNQAVVAASDSSGYVFQPSESQAFDYPAQYARFCDMPEILEDGLVKYATGSPPRDHDEGYYESITNDHPDCEPHLPSRFSTTTFYTSTSRYVNADLTSVGVPSPAANSLHFPTMQATTNNPHNGSTGKSLRQHQSSVALATQEDDNYYPSSRDFWKPRMRGARKVSLPTSAEQQHRVQPSPVRAHDGPGAFKIHHLQSIPRLAHVFRAPWAKRRSNDVQTTDEKWVLIDVRPIRK